MSMTTSHQVIDKIQKDQDKQRTSNKRHIQFSKDHEHVDDTIYYKDSPYSINFNKIEAISKKKVHFAQTKLITKYQVSQEHLWEREQAKLTQGSWHDWQNEVAPDDENLISRAPPSNCAKDFAGKVIETTDKGQEYPMELDYIPQGAEWVRYSGKIYGNVGHDSKKLLALCTAVLVEIPGYDKNHIIMASATCFTKIKAGEVYIANKHFYFCPFWGQEEPGAKNCGVITKIYFAGGYSVSNLRKRDRIQYSISFAEVALLFNFNNEKFKFEKADKVHGLNIAEMKFYNRPEWFSDEDIGIHHLFTYGYPLHLDEKNPKLRLWDWNVNADRKNYKPCINLYNVYKKMHARNLALLYPVNSKKLFTNGGILRSTNPQTKGVIGIQVAQTGQGTEHDAYRPVYALLTDIQWQNVIRKINPAADNIEPKKQYHDWRHYYKVVTADILQIAEENLYGHKPPQQIQETVSSTNNDGTPKTAMFKDYADFYSFYEDQGIFVLSAISVEFSSFYFMWFCVWICRIWKNGWRVYAF